MDNVTHSLTGLVLARAGLNRFGPGSTAVLMVSANLPDIDIIAAAGGALPYLEKHRGYTHSLLGLPLVAACSVLLACAMLRRWLPFFRLLLPACVGVASHLLLDWTNAYGIRLLLPFSSTWFHLDWNGLTDYVFVGLLLFACIWPYFGRLVSGEIGARGAQGRGVAWLVLSLFMALEATRAYEHARAIAQLSTVLYEDQVPVRVSALPTSANPFTWRTVVETSAHYQVGRLNGLTDSLPQEIENFRKLPRDPAIEAARRTEPFRFFEYFARFPVWSEQPASYFGPKATRLDLTDLRFGNPGGSAFNCIALVNAANRVVEASFTPGTGADLGWASSATMKQK